MPLLARTLLHMLLAAGIARATVTPQEFHHRREELRKSLKGAVVLFAPQAPKDQIFVFRQEPNFLYLTGWQEPGAVVLLTPDKEALFLPHHDERNEQFLGLRHAADDPGISASTGFDRVLPIERFEGELASALDKYSGLFALPDSALVAKLNLFNPFREVSDVEPALTKLRLIKSPAELAAIRHATAVTLEGHRAAWKRLASGLFEYQLAATLVDTYMENGCEALAYSPIVGSGKNGTVLHYFGGSRRLDRGDLVVMDSAAQCDNYASDITRTVPVSGKFSKRQRELYEIVLGAQKAAIAAIRPGVRMSGDGDSLTNIARNYFKTHGHDLHGESLEKYFTHGLGHPVGLQVHDPVLNEPLAAGMVVTVEPGLYIPEENIGIRIEDVVLVTAGGAEVLSAALPREPDELEGILAK